MAERSEAGRAPLVVVTGATRGLGRLVAEGAARVGARVVLACRDPSRGEEARAAVAAVATGPAPELLVVDLASLSSVRWAAAEAQRRFPRIDVLINNAGTFARRQELTADGFELSFATNHLGPFLLTRLLMPAMAPGGRIVNLSSDVYGWGKATPERPRRGGVWAGFMNYAASKRAVLQASLALAARESLRGKEAVRVNAIHPGVIRTEIMRIRTWYGFLVDLILAPFWSSAEAGVAAILDLALGARHADSSGGYYRVGRLVSPKRRVADPRKVEELWRQSSRLVGMEA
jgi:NAD(P)-dependent dehydrogenase (short-subunit alcohol dehydrogenase family)